MKNLTEYTIEDWFIILTGMFFSFATYVLCIAVIHLVTMQDDAFGLAVCAWGYAYCGNLIDNLYFYLYEN